MACPWNCRVSQLRTGCRQARIAVALREFFQKRLRSANPDVGIFGDKHGTLARALR
jgi:hypothetical protein